MLVSKSSREREIFTRKRHEARNGFRAANLSLVELKGGGGRAELYSEINVAKESAWWPAR